MTEKAAKKITLFGAVRRRFATIIHRVHANDTGVIGIMMIVIMWALIGVVAVGYNSSEYASRRQQMQNAADSAAHATATWAARATNAIAAQNMIIGQDASAAIIASAVTPTYNDLNRELSRETQIAQSLRDGTNAQWNRMQRSFAGMETRIASQYTLLSSCLDTVAADASQTTFANKNAQTEFLNSIRQAQEALSWVQNTYYMGSTAPAGQPGPPGPQGQGLKQLADTWANTPLNQAMIQFVFAALHDEDEDVAIFYQKTQGGQSDTVIAAMQEHEEQVFQSQQDTATTYMPQIVAQQLQQLETFYKAKMAVTRIASEDETLSEFADPTTITAPVKLASEAQPSDELQDSIRQTYHEEAVAAQLPATVIVDPINVSTGVNRVWHPNVAVQPAFAPNAVTLDCQEHVWGHPDNMGGWGHAYAFPLQRYVSERMRKDREGILSSYMDPIDERRSQLAKDLAQLAGTTNESVAALPRQITDTQPDPETKQAVTIAILPQLRFPTTGTASSDIRTEIDYTYNQYARDYINAIRTLSAALRQYGQFFDVFTVGIARSDWSNEVLFARDGVLEELGTRKQFMVTPGYRLWTYGPGSPLASWAANGMFASLQNAVYTKIMENSSRHASAYWLAWDLYQDPNVVQAIRKAAIEIATEMMNRPWPFEMEPPDQQVPPIRGMSVHDRQMYYSFLATAQADVRPQLFYGSFFDKAAPLVAYAQGETFNWMEYNASLAYGINERYDEVNWDVDHNYFSPAPVPWRLSTIGGWNWQPRLSFSDTLVGAMAASSDVNSMMQAGGIQSNNSEALKEVNLH